MGSILSLALAASLAAPMAPVVKAPPSNVKATAPVTATIAAKQAGNRSWVSRHPVAAGALGGAVVGLGIGLIAEATGDECPEGRSCSTAGAAPFIWTMLGAAAGTCVGLIVSVFR